MQNNYFSAGFHKWPNTSSWGSVSILILPNSNLQPSLTPQPPSCCLPIMHPPVAQRTTTYRLPCFNQAAPRWHSPMLSITYWQNYPPMHASPTNCPASLTTFSQSICTHKSRWSSGGLCEGMGTPPSHTALLFVWEDSEVLKQSANHYSWY